MEDHGLHCGAHQVGNKEHCSKELQGSAFLQITGKMLMTSQEDAEDFMGDINIHDIVKKSPRAAKSN